MIDFHVVKQQVFASFFTQSAESLRTTFNSPHPPLVSRVLHDTLRPPRNNAPHPKPRRYPARATQKMRFSLIAASLAAASAQSQLVWTQNEAAAVYTSAGLSRHADTTPTFATATWLNNPVM